MCSSRESSLLAPPFPSMEAHLVSRRLLNSQLQERVQASSQAVCEALLPRRVPSRQRSFRFVSSLPSPSLRCELPLIFLRRLQITHGFPVTSNPLFPTSSFPIESRPSETQTMGKVVSSLIPIVGDGTYSQQGGEEEKIKQVEKWAGDWHLLAYLQKEGGLEDVSGQNKFPFSQSRRERAE